MGCWALPLSPCWGDMRWRKRAAARPGWEAVAAARDVGLCLNALSEARSPGSAGALMAFHRGEEEVGGAQVALSSVHCPPCPHLACLCASLAAQPSHIRVA